MNCWKDGKEAHRHTHMYRHSDAHTHTHTCRHTYPHMHTRTHGRTHAHQRTLTAVFELNAVCITLTHACGIVCTGAVATRLQRHRQPVAARARATGSPLEMPEPAPIRAVAGVARRCQARVGEQRARARAHLGKHTLTTTITNTYIFVHSIPIGFEMISFLENMICLHF